jgi:hypothetical protein
MRAGAFEFPTIVSQPGFRWMHWLSGDKGADELKPQRRLVIS